MQNSILFPLLFSFFLFSICFSRSSHEATQLLKFIESSKSSKIMRDNWWNSIKDNRQFKVYISPHEGLKEADKIEKLAGQPGDVNFDQYSGYVTVDPLKGRALFYYFVEAAQDSSSKPLVLWLNGGPGCSSLGTGAMIELGPFRVNSDGKTLSTNEAAWNNVANVIFLESPASVGFSYSNTSSDYKNTGDKSTADDTYTFLINWLERFPHYKKRDFFITGESYAGHYIPQLASLILKNNAANKYTIVQLKGIAMGNAYVDSDTFKKGLYDYLWTHALISDETYSNIQSSCNFSSSLTSAHCRDATIAAITEIGKINQYDIYGPLCSESSNIKSTVQPDPCLINYVTSYLNLPEVQKALHVNGPSPYPWSICNDIGNRWHDSPVTMLPTIQELIGSGLRVWFYSGDQDSVVPVTSTRYFINTLKLPVESEWKPWYTNGQVGGYVIGYKGLTLATVRGAGHLVPSYQPERALNLFSSFLKGGF